ncbi:MAG: hypothetical protein ACO1PW_05930 [Actinomycetota bacterium]
MISGRGRGAALLLAASAIVLASGGCSDDEAGSAEELCAALREQPSVATTFEGFDPTDVDQALEQLRSARVTLGELRDAAPSEVRDDLTVQIDYVQALIEELEPLGGADATEIVAAVQRVTAEHPDVEAAAAELSSFSATTCS